MVWTFQDDGNRFLAVVNAALTGTPQVVNRNGEPAVVVLSAETYHQMFARLAGTQESFADHLLAFPAAGVERAGVTPRDGDV